MAETLNDLINAIGSLLDALCGLAIGFRADAVLATLSAALRSAQGAEVESELSAFALVAEACDAWRGRAGLVAAELRTRYHQVAITGLAAERHVSGNDWHSTTRNFGASTGRRSRPRQEPDSKTRPKSHTRTSFMIRLGRTGGHDSDDPPSRSQANTPVLLPN